MKFEIPIEGLVEAIAAEVVRQLEEKDAVTSRGPERWMTPAEAAAYAGKSPKRLWQLAREGRLEHGRDGASFRYRASAIDRYLRAAANTPDPSKCGPSGSAEPETAEPSPNHG